MSEKLVITVSIINEQGEILSSKEVSNKEILEPTDITNFGYDLQEQLNLIKVTQQELLEKQADFLK
jgi:hypothetical protein